MGSSSGWKRKWDRGRGSFGADSSGVQGVRLFANWELDLWGRIRAGRECSCVRALYFGPE